jgi:sulfoquinovose isomerase
MEPARTRDELDRLLAFAAASRHDGGGFSWLDDDGRPDASQPIFTWISTRMTHSFALGVRLGRPGSAAFVEHGVSALLGPLRDQQHDGWWEAVTTDGPVSTHKRAYDHAFVLLAAASALSVGAPRAEELFEAASGVFERRFWDDDAGKVVETWDRSWQRLDDYRGANSNMHATEALLAAHAVTGDGRYAEQAGRTAGWFVDQAAQHEWRIPEHYDQFWHPLLEYNADNPEDRFLPFGSTIGHGLEWSRLLLHVRATVPEEQVAVREHLLASARALFSRATADGWAVDGAPGFVYTVDWVGRPVVRDRMHWVVAEGIAAAAALESATGGSEYADWQRTLWDYADTYLIDPVDGSWWHQLDVDNRRTGTIWRGKPDIYHAVGAVLAAGSKGNVRRGG